ncbi:protein FAM185A-like [Amphiura filiformis]|uniref:protein FAM185A-like n=1 Tax=Amphiura filiformis TaxID=82378 RepID=UPI003B2142E0
MSVCRNMHSLLSSCGRATSLSTRIANCQGSKFLQQTTRWSALRILQTCTSKRSVFNTTISFCQKQEDSSSKHGHSVSEEQPQQSEKHQACHKLRSWSFNVDSFGKIVIQTQFNAIVKPVSPLEYPAADKAFITLTMKSKEKDDSLFETVTNSLQANAGYEDEQLFVAVHFLENIVDELKKRDASVTWLAEVPISFNADIQTSDHGTILLENLENQRCVIKSEHGNCHINKIKSGDVKITSLSGNIICKKVLQGNAEITTHGAGSITTGRLQGQTFLLSSEAGDINCNDVYTVKAGIKTTSGHIEFANVHGECDIETDEGNVDVGSLDGSLNAVTNTGNISTYLVRHKEVNISSQNGDISLKVPSDVKTGVYLEASTVSVSKELHTQSVEENHSSDRVVYSGAWGNEANNQLKAVTKQGGITVAVQSWFDSLKLTK